MRLKPAKHVRHPFRLTRIRHRVVIAWYLS